MFLRWVVPPLRGLRVVAMCTQGFRPGLVCAAPTGLDCDGARCVAKVYALTQLRSCGAGLVEGTKIVAMVNLLRALRPRAALVKAESYFDDRFDGDRRAGLIKCRMEAPGSERLNRLLI